MSDKGVERSLAGQLTRERLRLACQDTDGAFAPIVLLEAPRGYGKTVLGRQFFSEAAAWAADRHWVRCKKGNRAGFWLAFLNKLEAADPSEHDEPPEFRTVGSSEERAYEELARWVARLTRPTLIVLENYHHATSKAIDLELLHLVRSNASLHLLILARGTRVMSGPFGAEAIRILSADDLAFTAEETSQLAKVHGQNVDSAVALALQQADGWPLAVMAVLHALPRNSSLLPRAHQASAGLARFAQDEFAQLGRGEKQLLLTAAVTETISSTHLAEHCGFSEVKVLKRMRALASRGLVIEFALPGRRLYQCHRAVQAELAELARQTYSERERYDLLTVSAQEREDQDPLTAVEMYLHAGEFDAAERLVVSHFTILTDQQLLAERLVSQLSEDILLQYPGFAAVRLYLAIENPKSTPEYVERLTRVASKGAQQRIASSPDSSSFITLSHVMMQMIVDRMLGDSPGSLALARRLETSLPTRSSILRSIGSLELTLQPMFLSELAFTAYLGGDYALARRVWDRLAAVVDPATSASAWATVLGNPQGPTPLTNRPDAWKHAALGGLAIVEAFDGNYIEATKWLQEADALQERTGVRGPGLTWVNTEVARAHLSYELQDPSLLKEAVSRVEPVKDRIEHWPMMLMAEVETTRYLRGPDWAIQHLRTTIAQIDASRHGVGVWGGYLAIYRAMVSTTLGALETSRKILKSLPQDNLFVRFEHARLTLFRGDSVRALILIQRIGPAGLTLRQTIDKHLIAAVAAYLCARTEEAFISLAQAAALIERCGLSMMLRSVPYSQLASLAQEAKDAGRCDLTRDIAHVPGPARCVMREPLTAAEQRALEVMVTHPTLAEAAEHAGIAVATMKRHRLAVYKKLVVRGRDEAVLQATRMGLLQLPGRASD